MVSLLFFTYAIFLSYILRKAHTIITLERS